MPLDGRRTIVVISEPSLNAGSPVTMICATIFG